VAEAATIAESTPTLSEVTVFTGKVAQLVRLSAEQYGRADAASLLTDIVRRGHQRHAHCLPITGRADWPGGDAPGSFVERRRYHQRRCRCDHPRRNRKRANVHRGCWWERDPHHRQPGRVCVVVEAEDGDGFQPVDIGSGAADPLTRQLLGIPVLVTSAMTAGR